MSQQVKSINLADLVLWTENPRDPISARAIDQDVVDRALTDSSLKWNLRKLAKEMGPHYDLSELPTVHFHGRTPVVYDGNRRIALGKIKLGLVEASGIDANDIATFPAEIPCNVCSKGVALQNVYRKHADTGSWRPLERDIFLHKHMGQEKSPFLIIEEATGMISANPHLNQRFVKEEIFREDVLDKLGIVLKGEKVLSRHNSSETKKIFEDISDKVRDKTISTRQNRGQAVEVLDPENQRIVDAHRDNAVREVGLKRRTASETVAPKKTRRVLPKSAQLFGGPLYLRVGEVSNLYRDILDLHEFYQSNKGRLSTAFPALVRMALRLIAEAAAKDCKQQLDKYVTTRFAAAKLTLDQNAKTTLSGQNVSEASIVQLFHTGAHNYSAASNTEQTLALSIILGVILTASHGRTESK